MKRYKNEQINQNLDEVTSISQQVAANVRGIRLTVSQINTELMTVNSGLTHILEVGEEFIFFYTNEKDTLLDQARLCTHLRIRGVAVAKVHKQKPLTLTK